jgi:hypothetical protein
VLPGLPSNEKNSSDHHNSYNKGPNLAFFNFTESPSNSLPSIKFPKNHITSSYHTNMPETAKAKIWPHGTLGVNIGCTYWCMLHWKPKIPIMKYKNEYYSTWDGWYFSICLNLDEYKKYYISTILWMNTWHLHRWIFDIRCTHTSMFCTMDDIVCMDENKYIHQPLCFIL